jgi:tetratricopeptide (TPR) repeat protein
MQELIQEALVIYAEVDEPEGYALALHYAGTVDFYAQAYAAAEEKFLASIQVCRERNLYFRLSHPLNNLALMLTGLGRYREAKAYAEEAVDLLRRVHNQAILLYPLLQLGRAELALGEVESAHEHLQHSLILCREINDQIRLANVLEGLADWAMLTENYADARRMLAESLEINRRLGSSRFIAIDLNGLGLLDQQSGDFAAAAEKHRESYQLFAQLGHESGMAAALNYQARAALGRGDLHAAETFLLDALHLANRANAWPTLMAILCDWAEYLRLTAQHAAARRLLAFVRNQEATNFETRRRAERIWQSIEMEDAQGDDDAASTPRGDTALEQVLQEILPEPL